jgi:hypothetical protein
MMTGAVLALTACGSPSENAAPTAPGADSGPDGAGGMALREAGAPPPDAGAVPLMEAAPLPPDPCVEAGTCAPGTWINVTPSNANLVDTLDCGNYGSISMQPDPARPSDLYTQFNCQGVWKSTDYGLTWQGPINTGTGGSGASGAGGIVIPRASRSTPPLMYSAGIRGTGMGFWKSTDGGVSWTTYTVAPGGSRQDFYPPVVDPYDENHLIMAGHEMDLMVQSVDGGQTWTGVPIAAGMNENGGTAAIFFIDTGVAKSTHDTWLWLAQGSGGKYGTWRTSNAGGTWGQVDTNEHAHGTSQIYQPDTSGVLYMAGIYSAHGWGVLRSVDYGQTWAHVGNTGSENLVFGTPKSLYAMYGWASLDPVTPNLEVAAEPGTGSWTTTATPAAMTHGPGQLAVVFDGSHSVIVAASWTSGLWRYVEP